MLHISELIFLSNSFVKKTMNSNNSLGTLVVFS